MEKVLIIGVESIAGTVTPVVPQQVDAGGDARGLERNIASFPVLAVFSSGPLDFPGRRPGYTRTLLFLTLRMSVPPSALLASHVVVLLQSWPNVSPGTP